MITNERQYRITKAEAEKFKQALARLASDQADRRDIHPRLIQAEREGLESQLEDLERELTEYEALRGGQVSRIEIDSFDELPTGLIKARIAAGLSQKALAERLGLKEQQIQKYEAERYASASYQRLQEVVHALGVQIRKELFLPQLPLARTTHLLEKLRKAGIKGSFLHSRLLPSPLAADIELGVTERDEWKTSAQVGEVMSRIFGWTQSDLFGTADLPVPKFAAAEARFKMPARRSRGATSLYAAYANYLATVVLDGCRALPKEPVPIDAQSMREAILTRYGGLTLRSVLYFAWDLGVPVLPLKDPGTFHGACWRYGGRNIIVLKQATNYEARWLFDLIHELFHAGQNPDADVREIVEEDETSEERRTADEEIAASQFAGDVVLGERSEALANACVAAANKSVERLKRVVPLIAQREGVSVGSLANYLAFRLSWQDINWWGTAANLQGSEQNSWETARDVFFERFPFAVEGDLDRQLLQLALQ
jgi:transcriptional regulator with XRE-family HTH domain